MKNADMLVKLYEIDDDISFIAAQKAAGITIRLPRADEKQLLIDWVADRYSPTWVSETQIAFQGASPTCFIALSKEKIVGFCCFDTSALGFCGPIGVDPSLQKRGIGKALLLASLLEMKKRGYGYAIIGWVQESQFRYYEKTVGATEIPNSFPGIYASRLRKN